MLGDYPWNVERKLRPIRDVWEELAPDGIPPLSAANPVD
jgi:hypothetical protein